MYADYVVSDDDIEEQNNGNSFQQVYDFEYVYVIQLSLLLHQELEEILYENNVRSDIAWEAILGVKVLLALESKYDYLVEERQRYNRK